MADKKAIQITEENIEQLNIKTGTVLKDNEGTFWKIAKFDDFMASMKVCDKSGNEIKDCTGNAVRSVYGGGLAGLLNDDVSTYFIETEQPEITNEPLKHVFKKEMQSGADQDVKAVSLSDLSAEELRESLKYALSEAAEELPEIDFTRENYNKLFPYSKIDTPIETVKIGAHQFEKLENKDRKNLLQAVHDVLSNPDVIINEEKESVFGDTENSHVYAKSYVINEKTKAVQSVVVNIENEYVSISTHKRDISNVVNKIKKPDQLLFAAAKVRLLAERLANEKSVTVNPNRENEYVIPPQISISQSQEKSSNSELTAEDLKNASVLLPKEQYQLVLSYIQGEEGEHFKGIIKEISSKAEEIKGKTEILTEDEKHPLAFKYTLGNSSFYFSEWDGKDEFFGYAILNGDTQMSEWGYTSLEELKNAGGKDRNGFPVMPEMAFYRLEDTIEKQISVDYPELSEKMGFEPEKSHNEELISKFGKQIFETLQSRRLEQSAYNICCAAQFVLRTMDFSERKEVFAIMEKCGCKGKNGKEETADFLTEIVKAENNTTLSVYDRKRLYGKINKSCETKSYGQKNKNQRFVGDYDIEV